METKTSMKIINQRFVSHATAGVVYMYMLLETMPSFFFSIYNLACVCVAILCYCLLLLLLPFVASKDEIYKALSKKTCIENCILNWC